MYTVLYASGHALASEHHIQHLLGQVRNHACHIDAFPVVVVSAMVGIPDRLHTLTRLVRANKTQEASTLLAQIKHLHRERACELIHDPIRLRMLCQTLDASFCTLEQEVLYLSHLPYGSVAVPQHFTRVLTWGERLAVVLVAAALEGAGVPSEAFTDALVLTANPSSEEAYEGSLTAPALLTLTRRYTYQHLLPILGHGRVPVVAGGLAQTEQGCPTTLGLHTATHTAALLAVALNAGSLTIFTMAPGLLSADPHVVPDPVSLTHLSFAEAQWILAAGDHPLTPHTLNMLAARHIPCRVCSLVEPHEPGTLLSSTTLSSEIGALALYPAVALLTCTAHVSVSQTDPLVELLSRMSHAGVHPLLVHLAASQHMTVLLEDHTVEAVMAALAQPDAFWDVRCQRDLAACICVGEVFGHQTFTLAYAVIALLGAQIAVQAQSWSELGMVLVVQAEDGEQALRCLHRQFIHPVVSQNAQEV